MRADRLLSILMLLKAKGRLTARELADELAVSTRTIYRDMDALSSAHFPIYADKGQNGGYALLPDYELDLTGFSDRDVQALAALNIPEPFFEIGLGSGLKTALSKLLVVLGEDLNNIENGAQTRLIIEPASTRRPAGTDTNLLTIKQAVWQDHCISCRIIYPIHFGTSDPIILAPYTLIAEGGQWYLIGHRSNFYQVFPLTQLMEVRLTDMVFVRADDFDASSIWKRWISIRSQNSPVYPVRLEMQPDMMGYFSGRYGIPFRELPEKAHKDGWHALRVDFGSLEQARTILLGLGGAVKVISPEALRISITDYAKQALIINNEH